MPPKIATQEQADYIKAHYQTLEDPEIAAHLGVKKTTVLKWRKQLGFTKDSGRQSKKEQPEDNYHFSWNNAKKIDFIIGNV